jgi:hypothetical protein
LYNPKAKHSKTRWLNSRDVIFLEDQLVDIDGILASTHLGEGEQGEDVFPDADVALSPSQNRNPEVPNVADQGNDGLPDLIPPPAAGVSGSELDIFNLDVGDEQDADVYEDDEDAYEFLDTLPLRRLYPAQPETASRAQQALYAIQLVQQQQEEAREQQCWALSTTVLDTDEPSTYAEAMARPDAHL